MLKNFKEWHKNKSEIHNNKQRPFFHEKEVWFSSLGSNIGFEQDGVGDNFLRPVLIIKKFNNEVFWGIPTTKKDKKGLYYFKFNLDKEKTSSVILSQIRLIDSKRLFYKIGNVTESDFKEIKKRIISFLE